MKRLVSEIYVDGELQPRTFSVVQEAPPPPRFSLLTPAHWWKVVASWWLKDGSRYVARLADDPVVELVEETETVERWRVEARRR